MERKEYDILSIEKENNKKKKREAIAKMSLVIGLASILTTAVGLLNYQGIATILKSKNPLMWDYLYYLLPYDIVTGLLDSILIKDAIEKGKEIKDINRQNEAIQAIQRKRTK